MNYIKLQRIQKTIRKFNLVPNELGVLSVEALVGSLEFRWLLAAVKTVRVVVDSLCNLFLCEVLDVHGFVCVVGDFDAVDTRPQLLGVHDFLTGCERVLLCCDLNRNRKK
mgnify:CR=1 FL=1